MLHGVFRKAHSAHDKAGWHFRSSAIASTVISFVVLVRLEGIIACDIKARVAGAHFKKMDADSMLAYTLGHKRLLHTTPPTTTSPFDVLAFVAERALLGPLSGYSLVEIVDAFFRSLCVNAEAPTKAQTKKMIIVPHAANATA